MNFNKFPSIIKEEIERETREKINREVLKSNAQKDNIKKSAGSKPEGCLTTFGFGLAGFAIGFFICCANCEATSYSEALGPWIFFTILGVIIGAVFEFIINKSYDNRVASMNSQLSMEDKYLEAKKEKIQKDAEDKYNDYLNEFETAAQKLSVNFVESILAKEIIDWMSKGFLKTIDAADRRSHVEKISVPFVFNVYVNIITCNLGVYDFELMRCRNLAGPTEQAALSRVIASGLRFNATMKFPKDPSGTGIAIDITYAYGSDFVTTTVSYEAPNGYFKAVRDWT